MPVTRAAAATADAAGRVYAAVAAGKGDEEVRRVIGECRNEQQRKAAVNATDPSNEETPLAAAHRLQGGDLIGALLEAGAERASSSGTRRRWSRASHMDWSRACARC
jgi:hypothetical protein